MANNNARNAQAPDNAPRRPPVPPAQNAASFDDLFIPAGDIRAKVRLGLWGGPSTFKTRTALSFPRPAVISVDGLAEAYAGEFPDAFFFPGNTIEAVERGIQTVAAQGRGRVETLVIDSLTPIYDDLKARYLKASKRDFFTQPDWVRINVRMKSIYNALAMLPFHVVVVLRQTDKYEEIYNEAGEKTLRRVDDRADIDKNFPYLFHFIVKTTGGGAGIVQKVQGMPLPQTQIQDISWNGFFKDIAARIGNGEDSHDIRAGLGKQLFLAHWNGLGLKNSQIIEALGIKNASEWTRDRAAADAQVQEYAVNQGWIPDPNELPPDDLDVQETEGQTPAPAMPRGRSPFGKPVNPDGTPV